MKKKELLLSLLFFFIAGVSYSERFSNFQGSASPGFKISLSYSFTNAISVSNTIVVETINGESLSVNVFTFTIPFFEKNFRGKLDLANLPEINSKGFIPPSKIPTPCNGGQFRLYDAFSLGKIIGSVQDAMELHIHDYVGQLGINNLRVEANCRDMVYAKQYFRIIIKREDTPTVGIRLNLKEKKSNLKADTKFENEPISFKLTGNKVENKNLYLRIIPPCGFDCRKTDYEINEAITDQTASSSEFYTCDLIGLYSVKIIYKADKIGGGVYDSEVSVPNWTNYSFLNAEKEKQIESSKQNLPKETHKIKINPNPVTDILFVELPKRDKYSISDVKIYDISGQILMLQETNSNNFRIDVSGLITGTYIVTVFFEGKSYSDKVIKN